MYTHVILLGGLIQEMIQGCVHYLNWVNRYTTGDGVPLLVTTYRDHCAA